MPTYDPKRTRPARDDEADAPIEGLLVPPAAADDAVVDLRVGDPVLGETATVAEPRAASDRPISPVLNVPPPDPGIQRVAVVAGVAAAAAVLILILRRRRRR